MRRGVAGIYLIRNIVTNVAYVGSTINLKERIQSHKTCLRRNAHANVYLQNAWNRHEENVFDFAAIEIVENVNNLTAREQHWIDFYQQAGEIYNIALVARSSLGVMCSEATKAKISAAKRGKKSSPEARAKISAALIGKKVPDERRAKIAASKTGIKLSPEIRAKRLAAKEAIHAARVASGEIVPRYVAPPGKHFNFGRPQSAEARAKLAATNTGSKRSAETKARMSIAQLARYAREK